MICRICTNGRDLKTVRTKQGQYVQCPTCGCLFVEPYPVRELNEAFQGPLIVERLQREGRQRRGYFGRRLTRLENRLGNSPGNSFRYGRLLDVGCGAGMLLQEAWCRGWQADAIEFSADLAAAARQNNPEAQVITGDIQNLEPFGIQYDAIISLDVLEHVLAPMTMIENCRELLKPGGLLLLQTPNTRSLRSRTQGANWELLDPAQHLNLFSPDALRVLLTTVGFDILETTTASGAGRETGVAMWSARLKESLLGLLNLGSALVVVARRPV